jgi:23S rRNA U2552 (ribose-2'-O)-methylase RlmE/FtsJ
MIEILHLFRFSFSPQPIRSFHLAEGPGGFIEALLHYRNQPLDIYYGMTLQNDPHDKNIPKWKKSTNFLNQNKNVIIENGKDGTGNILSLTNFIYVKNKYASSMDFITADGGFDFSRDFNNQEVTIGRLIFCQICFALCLQSKGGSFVLKVFDCFMQHTIDMLYILSFFYKKVYITKPQTSRYANSEKYIVCVDFTFSSCETFYPVLLAAFTKVSVLEPEKSIARFFTRAIPSFFLTKIEEFNSIFGQQQIENIFNTISLIETKYNGDKIDNLVKSNVQKSVSWCLKHGILYNSFLE